MSADHSSVSLSLSDYQDYYSRRVKHLEKFKRTFGTTVDFSEDPDLQTAMLSLKENMVTLIEQDVTLMRQLMGIKDAIEEIKSSRCDSPSSDSQDSSGDKEEKPIPPNVLRIPIKKHKSRNLTHDSYDSQSSGFCSQTSSPTDLVHPPVRPPRKHRSRSCHQESVDLVLTDPQEVNI